MPRVTVSVTDELPGMTPSMVTVGAVVEVLLHVYGRLAAPPVVPAAGSAVIGRNDAVSM